MNIEQSIESAVNRAKKLADRAFCIQQWSYECIYDFDSLHNLLCKWLIGIIASIRNHASNGHEDFRWLY